MAVKDLSLEIFIFPYLNYFYIYSALETKSDFDSAHWSLSGKYNLAATVCLRICTAQRLKESQRRRTMQWLYSEKAIVLYEITRSKASG